jgi:hypothetical protein
MRSVKKAARPKRTAAEGPAVDAVFDACPKPVKTKLLALRRLIFDTAKATKGVGTVEETLKWGQPSYLTPETGSGSTIRIDRVKSADNQVAVFFHCQTDLVETFASSIQSSATAATAPSCSTRTRSCRRPNCDHCVGWR